MHDFEGLGNQQSCHWSDEVKKKQDFFLENRAPGILGLMAAIEAL